MTARMPRSTRAGGADELDVWLVWCFEHCFKSEHGQVRKELEHLAAMFGCKFTCFKKSTGFLSWLDGDDGVHARALLVADWREAKPTIEELSRRSDRRDVRTCMVAQTEKAFRNASLFASRQRTGAQLLVTLGFSREAVQKFVSSYIHTHATSPSPVPTPDETLGFSLPSLLVAE